MTFSETKHLYDKHVLNTYSRFPVSFVRGEGVRLYDAEGTPYLDFASGLGVCSVGYAHPKWTEAVAAQAQRIAHASNLYYTEPGALLAERLCRLGGMSGVFFAGSGAEANEGMIKTARKYASDTYGAGRFVIVTLKGSFHGRTHTTLAATGQEVFHKNFQPLTPGFRHVPRHDLAALENQPDDVCAVMLELVQGEGGVWPLERDYLLAVQALCRERGWLLLIDEVQTGIGRTGAWFAYQTAGLAPDVVSFAKGIAGGLPLGGFLCAETTRSVLGPGDHAGTFGGNPVCCAAALAVLDIIEPVLPEVSAKGRYLRERLPNARGQGLMLGIPVPGRQPRELAEKALRAGLVCLTAGQDALRLLPPLIVSYEDCDEALETLKGVLAP